MQASVASIRGAADLPALKVAFDKAKADKSLTKQEAADLIGLKEKRKSDLTPATPRTLDEHLDRLQVEGATQ